MMVDDGTVFMVDDDASVRDALSLLLSLKGLRMQAFADGESFLAAYRDTSAGCLLTDLRMPGISGLAVQSALRGIGSRIPVIVLTAYGDLVTARAAFKDGAFDFLEKPVDQTTLLEVLEAALRTDRVRRSQLPSESAPGLERLTTRERDIAKLMVAGHQNREIAAQLGISHRTVEVHRAHVMEKLRCRSLADLIRLKLPL
jgi:FixJ family two-component response regulator